MKIGRMIVMNTSVLVSRLSGRTEFLQHDGWPVAAEEKDWTSPVKSSWKIDNKSMYERIIREIKIAEEIAKNMQILRGHPPNRYTWACLIIAIEDGNITTVGGAVAYKWSDSNGNPGKETTLSCQTIKDLWGERYTTQGVR